MVKHETVLPSQKYDFHPIFADFEIDQFSFGFFDIKENIRSKPLHSCSFADVKPVQSQYKKPIKKINKTLIQKPAFLIDEHVSDVDDLIEGKIPQNDGSFSPDLSLIINPSTSENVHDSENEILQLPPTHEAHPFVIKQSLQSFSKK